MRFIAGLVVGALLVVGAAYVHDANVDLTRDREARTLVDWPAVSASVQNASDWIVGQVGWIGDRLRHSG